MKTVVDRQGRKGTLMVADGAAIGSEMNELYQLMCYEPSVKCYLPESFEWLVLKSGIVDGKTVQDILNHPEDFMESRDYFSWERFFTAILVEYTKDTYLKYSKSKLNEVYLRGKIKQAILDVMEGIQWDV